MSGSSCCTFSLFFYLISTVKHFVPESIHKYLSRFISYVRLELVTRERTTCQAFLREEGGRRSLTEGACGSLTQDKLYCVAFSLSHFVTAPSRKEPLISSLSTSSPTIAATKLYDYCAVFDTQKACEVVIHCWTTPRRLFFYSFYLISTVTHFVPESFSDFSSG